MKIEIKNRYTGSVLFSIETDSWKLAVEAAVKAGAELRGAYLEGADLGEANLRGADLREANLREVDLSQDQLIQFRDDIWAVLSSSPKEVDGLISALQNGKVDGSTYEGDCACLVGTIANTAHVEYDALPILKANSNRLAEVFFMLIKKGDTPKKSKWAKMALGWIEEWKKNMEEAFGK